MIMYKIYNLYGVEWIVYPTLDAAMDAIRDEIECLNMSPDEYTIRMEFIEMTQEEFDALPKVDL